MRCSYILVFLVIFSIAVSFSAMAPAQELIRINEFLAVNDTGLDDEDRDESDWIEIYNAGDEAVELGGWYLTDDVNNLTRWVFPDVTLAPDAYLVVFASGKDRENPLEELHTNFRLRGAGEYLGLIRPDGKTVVSEFSPQYPKQAPDISYGSVGSFTEKMLLTAGAPAKALIPQDDTLEAVSERSEMMRLWTKEELDDLNWRTGITGVGYDYSDLVGLDVSEMRNVNTTVYIRVPFVVEDPSAIDTLTLRMRFDDGMITYINGREVARANAPAPGEETWNSSALESRPDDIAVNPVDFTIPRFDFLHIGANLLAVQGLNNQMSSSDLLIIPELLATVDSAGGGASCHFFPTPTPGKPNNVGVDVLGPVISDTEHFPLIPTEDENLKIVARIEPYVDSVDNVMLYYRVMFDRELNIPMLDDGTNGDAEGGDGLYSVRIPSYRFAAGQMVRWFIVATDTTGRMSRFPAYIDPLNSPQYDGTIVDDPSLTNPLPVFHWFIWEPQAANTNSGTRCALFYDGEFYDNLLINIHGQSSRSFPKKSYDIDFHPGYNFKWVQGQPRADDINLMTTYPDKAQMRNILAYETYRDAGCPYHWVFPVRVQQNGAFWGTAHVMENGDEDWLIRMGLNIDGALYKMYNSFNSSSHVYSGAEKKTRKYEDNDDLSALYGGLSLSGEELRRYLYENVDVAQVVNFLAIRAITGDVDCCHKNYYFYRDTGISNEWQMWPWDVDLSFGRVWNSSESYWNENLIPGTGLFVGRNNRLPDAIFDNPETREMYLRRVRTLMDDFLKAPSASERSLYYEPRINMLAALIAPDAALDAAKWGSHAWGNGSTSPCCPQSLQEAAEELKYSYLPERRRQLFNGLASGANEIPDAQPVNAVIDFGDIETLPISGNLDGQYIQLVNPNYYAVDISGWSLSIGQDTGTDLFTFRGGTVIPANGNIYVAADRIVLRRQNSERKGGPILFIVGDFSTRLATQDEVLLLTNQEQAVVSFIVTTQAVRR
ncbi:MAG: CotH kinase family protein [Sedimentisphaerales bacterium]|nr:CotH kinase family protein [Sedimentisphaerales bacterium]